MELKSVAIEKPDEMNFILGHAHFIKTVEDLHEAMVNSGPFEFGIAFAEASLPCLVRSSGNNDDLIKLAETNILNIGAGHSFIIFINQGFPINVLPAIRSVREVCRVFTATANPTEVILAETEQGRAILGVVDGESPKGIEEAEDKQKRHEFLRMIKYKL